MKENLKMEEDVIYKWNLGDLSLKLGQMIGEIGLKEMNLNPKQKTHIPCMSYGFQKGSRYFLIDTGLDHGKKPMGFMANQVYRPQPSKELPPQYYLHSFDIYCTHLHSDHVGNLGSLKYHTVVAHSDEVKAALKGGLDYHVKLLSDLRFQELFTDQFIIGGYPFKYIDLYKDDSFIIFHTPGHSAGHLSFLLEYHHFHLLFCGDMIEGYLGLKYPPNNGYFSQTLYENGIGLLKEWLKQDRNLILLPAHETEIDKLLINGKNDVPQIEQLADYQELKFRQMGLFQ